MDTVVSKDGTRLAYERVGKGPPVVLVDGALCSRGFGPMPGLARLLADRYTVYTYDRRGRGGSTDTLPYAREREIDDLAALIDAAGGSAHLVGLSSGGALALEAAAAGLPIGRVVAYEPPYVGANGGSDAGAAHQQQLTALVEAGRRGAAVDYFMRRMVGAPLIAVVVMRLMFWVWRKFEAVAHTLPYDAAIMGDWRPPTERLAAIRVPTLVLYGERSDARLRAAAEAAGRGVPTARIEALPKQTHDVKLDVLAPAVDAFLRAPT